MHRFADTSASLGNVIVSVRFPNGERMYFTRNAVMNANEAENKSGDTEKLAGLLRKRYLLTSVTKPFLCELLVYLFRRENIDFASKIATWLPEFRDGAHKDITVQNVLVHTTGIDDSKCLSPVRSGTIYEAAAYYRSVCAAPIVNIPGSTVEYSSETYWLLAQLIEVIAGKSYTSFFDEVFRLRFGLTSAGFDPLGSAEYVDSESEYYHAIGERVRRTAYPAGGLLIDIVDLLKYGEMHLDEGCPDAFAPVLEAVVPSFTRTLPGRRAFQYTDPEMERTRAWICGFQDSPGSVLWHVGASGTGLWIDRTSGLVVALLSTSWGSSTEYLINWYMNLRSRLL